MAKECGTGVHHSTLQAIVRTESAFNPYAIGVVGGSIKQPTNLADAVAAAYKLHSEGKNFSIRKNSKGEIKEVLIKFKY